MKSKFTILLAVGLIFAAATTQAQGPDFHDRRDIRIDRREIRNDRRDVRFDRRDVRFDRLDRRCR
jgi:hypothetical protein